MRYMFTMMNNARLSVGLRGPVARRAGLPDGARLRQGAPPGPGARARRPASSRSIVDHPDVRRMLLTQRASHRGAARRSSTPTRPPSTAPPATPTRPTRAAGDELADLLTPVSKGVGHRPRRRAHEPRPPGVRRHGLHRGDRRRPALPRRPHRADLRGHQRHPGHGPRRPQAPDARGRRRRRLPRPDRRHRRPSSAAAGDDLASIHAAPGRRARRARAPPPTGSSPTGWPTRSTRWPAPRPTCGCSASSPAAG